MHRRYGASRPRGRSIDGSTLPAHQISHVLQKRRPPLSTGGLAFELPSLDDMSLAPPSHRSLAIASQRSLTFAAAVLPFLPCSIWNSTACPSRSSVNPDC